MESTAVSVSTLDMLIEYTRDLQFGKVRRTTFYPLVAELFRQTEGQDPELRRTLAFQHLLDGLVAVCGQVVDEFAGRSKPVFDDFGLSFRACLGDRVR